ncbi:hypothetical protein [Undibacterium rugosum]|uniref:hypothetical protein n=1 Tax=Undibacterium rugosum TaxID=2762291 RepID=UPI001B818B8A|nr:hypothetical protein [Undibacterium rugosum]MBR7778932.1 hypothetical protein [Undibacterium rugosum]
MTAQKKQIPTCFVIQSFDGGKFDQRYKETIRPALLRAEVEPQRADEILGLNPVIEKIESAIKAASICIAEVSEDNPNVWLELGYALALGRPTVILCEKAVRSKLPFDVQHRPIILYRTDSRSGYEELEENIVKWVKNELITEQRIAFAPTLRPESEGVSDLEAYDVAILSTAFAFWPTSAGSISYWELEKKLKRDHFTELGIALGIANLLDRSFLVERQLLEESINGDYYVKHYQITPDGIAWLRSHKELLTVKTEEPKVGTKELDDEIPF